MLQGNHLTIDHSSRYLVDYVHILQVLLKTYILSPTSATLQAYKAKL